MFSFCKQKFLITQYISTHYIPNLLLNIMTMHWYQLTWKQIYQILGHLREAEAIFLKIVVFGNSKYEFFSLYSIQLSFLSIKFHQIIWKHVYHILGQIMDESGPSNTFYVPTVLKNQILKVLCGISNKIKLQRLIKV